MHECVCYQEWSCNASFCKTQLCHYLIRTGIFIYLIFISLSLQLPSAVSTYFNNPIIVNQSYVGMSQKQAGLERAQGENPGL